MKRAWLALIVSVLVALLGGRDARADGVADIRPRAAAHAGFVAGDVVTWTSTYAHAASSDASSNTQRLRLAQPMRATLDADRSPGVAPVVDADGRIVAFIVDPGRVPGWSREVRVTTRAKVEREGEEIVLFPPFAPGELTQRVEVAGEGDVRFEPAPSMGLVHNVGSWSTPGISERDRRAIDDALGGHDTPLDEPPLYLEAGSALSHGLRGRTLTAVERARPGMLVAITVFLLLVIGVVAAYRWLGGSARVEQAEAVLREEFERTGPAR